MNLSFLLPRWLRSAAYLFIPAGAALLIARFFFGFKPEVLELKVFAIYSAYLEAKSMTIIQNQVIEELGALLLLSGLFMLAFTKEKTESELTNKARLSSFFISAYSTFILLAFGILFTYGFGFAFIMTLNLFIWLVVYNISFRYIMYRLATRNREKTINTNTLPLVKKWQPN